MPNIEEIWARCDAATPGPWTSQLCQSGEDYRIENDNQVFGVVSYDRDADFITRAREDIPALLAHIEALEARLAEVERERDAAVADLKQAVEQAGNNNDCFACMNEDCSDCCFEEPCGPGNESRWQWRGVPERT